MAGIYGVLLKNNQQKDLYKNFYNSTFETTIREEITVKNFCFGRSVLDKFNDDRFLYQNEEYVICFEGINYSKITTPEKFIEAYIEKGSDFIKSLKGTFSGFIFSKKEEKLFIFNDHLSTKSVFYFYDKDLGFAFSSEMHVLSKLLRDHGISISYDFDGIYSLALYGQMFNDFTIVKEIKKLRYGSVLNFDSSNNSMKTEHYYKFSKKETSQSLEDVIETLDGFMINSIREEWQKDEDNNYERHLGLISGGMDSRVNTLIAKKMGFNKIDAYTYGNPESSDVKIANKIAKENFNSHLQYNLHKGDFLTENILENYVKATDGLTHFTANAIIYNVMSRINCQDYGMIHSGQLGDTVSGSFLKPDFNFKKNRDKIGLTGFVKQSELLDKMNFLEDLTNTYQHTDYELFAYEQRQVNGTLMGDRVFNNFIDLSSPFYQKDLLSYMLTVPNTFKLNQRIYFEWLQKKHPEVLVYKWEKIGLKPNSSFNINYGRLIKKYVNGGKKYFGLKYDSMNPISNWFQENPTILEKFDVVFKENIELIEDQELQKDLIKIYQDDIFEYRNKFAVITVILAIKLHFYN
ncbi:asparagine synthase-related protein [Mesonia sp. MT50]|uniref:asparagine synthase (glutamine-hydrolyzing) n=1 Tax=Mesonia profundi TaxID=3070998 RepID=A0ABU0ZYZ3_9FLAO|nr:asparagine synthase-related protein [Mesonia profundi]MDQ7916540.1 asparagine synthase-related protein [Mesonia profundi]